MTSTTSMEVCHLLQCDVSMLIQNVPCGAGKGLSPADLQNEQFAHDTSGQTFSFEPLRLMISQKLCREPQLTLSQWIFIFCIVLPWCLTKKSGENRQN